MVDILENKIRIYLPISEIAMKPIREFEDNYVDVKDEENQKIK